MVLNDSVPREAVIGHQARPQASPVPVNHHVPDLARVSVTGGLVGSGFGPPGVATIEGEWLSAFPVAPGLWWTWLSSFSAAPPLGAAVIS